MPETTFHLDREVVICARPATVFRFFTDSQRFASWWGEGSTIEPSPRGALRIVYPNGIEAGGEVQQPALKMRITGQIPDNC